MVERKNVKNKYEPTIAEAREGFVNHPVVQQIFGPDVDAQTMLRFMINFSSFGVGMTEQVDQWIRRAGNRCIELGYSDLGSALVDHAHHEEGHHLMMVADTKFLVSAWNDLGYPTLSVDAVLNRALPESVAAYQKLHEDIVASDAPYAQIAVEFEIEALSVRFGGPLVQLCVEKLGEEAIAGLSFVQEHALLDIGHTAFNEGQMDKFLMKHPDTADSLTRAGACALDAYANFVQHCFEAELPLRATVTQRENAVRSTVANP